VHIHVYVYTKGREGGKEGRYLFTKLRMKESGSLDLKAVRKDHIFPMKGQPKSPRGSESFFAPSLASYNHQFTLFRIHCPTPNPQNMTTKTTHMDPNPIPY